MVFPWGLRVQQNQILGGGGGGGGGEQISSIRKNKIY